MGVLWRRRWVVIATFLVFVVVAGVVSKVLPKVYETSNTLIVVQRENAATFDAVQAAQVTARTFADVVVNSTIEAAVATQVGQGATPGSISAAITVTPVPETQLLKITASDRRPARAQELANAYAAAVISYVRKDLTPAAGATVTQATVAPEPGGPARPKPTLYVLIAAILGLSVGAGLTFLIERLDTRLKDSEELEARFGETSILARVPLRKGEGGERGFVESYAMLRTTLQMSQMPGKHQVIAVTSAQEGEGKTTCVHQLAVAVAQVGSSVVAVDADLRRPALRKTMMPESGGRLGPGLTDALTGLALLEDVVYATPTANLDIVPEGTLPFSSATILSSPRLPELIDELATESDLVVVDCPPLSAGADAAIIGSFVDGVIVVVDLQRTDERLLRETLRQLETVQAKVVGFVVNRDRSDTGAAYYYDESSRKSTAVHDA